MAKHKHEGGEADWPLSPIELAKEQDEQLAEEAAEFEALFDSK